MLSANWWVFETTTNLCSWDWSIAVKSFRKLSVISWHSFDRITTTQPAANWRHYIISYITLNSCCVNLAIRLPVRTELHSIFWCWRQLQRLAMACSCAHAGSTDSMLYKMSIDVHHRRRGNFAIWQLISVNWRKSSGQGLFYYFFTCIWLVYNLASHSCNVIDEIEVHHILLLHLHCSCPYIICETLR